MCEAMLRAWRNASLTFVHLYTDKEFINWWKCGDAHALEMSRQEECPFASKRQWQWLSEDALRPMARAHG